MTLEARVPALDRVVYHAKLGTQGERTSRVCALIERGHPGARATAPDRQRDPCGIKARRSQIGPHGIIVVVTVAVRKRAVAIHASGASPNLQTGPDLGVVLRKSCRRLQ